MTAVTNAMFLNEMRRLPQLRSKYLYIKSVTGLLRTTGLQ